jgi:8-oxo-dGTP pyrophosphatase MutT (NUDIX family)
VAAEAPRRGGPQRVPRPLDARPGKPAPWLDLSPAERHVDVARVREAFSSEAQRRPRPARIERPQTRRAAVLAPLYDRNGEAWVVLTRRAQGMRSHQGEVSFPGGRRDGDEPLVATALREAEEEIRLDPGFVEIVGELDHLTTAVSSVAIAPFVGALRGPPEGLRPADAEVERILHVRVSELLEDGVFHEEVWDFGGMTRPMWFFDLEGDTVWGATAALLRQLLGRVLGLAPETWARPGW